MMGALCGLKSSTLRRSFRTLVKCSSPSSRNSRAPLSMPSKTKANVNFDVIVVGSGASGGWVCKKLAEAGVKVALVDAGRPLAESEFVEHKPAFELKYRDRAPEVITRTRPIQ